MRRVGFEPMTPVSEWAKTNVIGILKSLVMNRPVIRRNVVLQVAEPYNNPIVTGMELLPASLDGGSDLVLALHLSTCRGNRIELTT
jgi:hypothetical protein